jgi:CheY-like chemotaxis protein
VDDYYNIVLMVQLKKKNMEKNKDSKKIILVVDDDPIILDLYQQIFETKGVKALVAKDGEEGLKMILQEKPSFVILDIRMPKLDGIEVLRLMRNDNSLKDIPVLILTNFGLDEYKEKVQKLGVVGFLAKTEVEPAQVVQMVIDSISKE